MSESFWGRLRRMLGGRPAPPKGPPPRRSSSARPAPRPSAGLRHMEAPGAPPPATVRWQKERFGPRMLAPAWMRRASRRQKILAVLGAASVVALGVTVTARLLVERRLPAEVQGLWRTDAPAYAGRVFELRARRIAFVAGDSVKTVITHIIGRVRHEPTPDGTLYRVGYGEKDHRGEFSFIHHAGPPESIRFAHQLHLSWKRDPSNRSLLPEF